MISQILAKPFNQDSAALSDQELTKQLEAMGCQDVSFGRGTIQSMLAGLLQYNSPGRPSNLSIFWFFEKLRDGSKTTDKLLLWAMQKDGKQDQKKTSKNLWDKL